MNSTNAPIKLRRIAVFKDKTLEDILDERVDEEGSAMSWAGVKIKRFLVSCSSHGLK